MLRTRATNPVRRERPFRAVLLHLASTCLAMGCATGSEGMPVETIASPVQSAPPLSTPQAAPAVQPAVADTAPRSDVPADFPVGNWLKCSKSSCERVMDGYKFMADGTWHHIGPVQEFRPATEHYCLRRAEESNSYHWKRTAPGEIQFATWQFQWMGEEQARMFDDKFQVVYKRMPEDLAIADCLPVGATCTEAGQCGGGKCSKGKCYWDPFGYCP